MKFDFDEKRFVNSITGLYVGFGILCFIVGLVWGCGDKQHRHREDIAEKYAELTCETNDVRVSESSNDGHRAQTETYFAVNDVHISSGSKIRFARHEDGSATVCVEF